jgi:hypothetical protein
MSVCNPCTPTEPIANCITDLVVGKIAFLSTAVYVFLHDITLDRIVRFSTTSSPTGIVTIQRGSQVFMPDHSYEIWITLTTATNPNAPKESIQIGSNYYDCLSVRFQKVYDSTNTSVSYLSQTLNPI